MIRNTVSKALELKEFTKESLELEAKRIREELVFERQRLKGIEDILSSTVAEFNNRQDNAHCSASEMEVFYDYLNYINKHIEQQREIVRRKTAELEEKEKAVLEAYKEKKLYELLHDKILQSEIKEALVAEQKEVDFNFITRKHRS